MPALSCHGQHAQLFNSSQASLEVKATYTDLLTDRTVGGGTLTLEAYGVSVLTTQERTDYARLSGS